LEWSGDWPTRHFCPKAAIAQKQKSRIIDDLFIGFLRRELLEVLAHWRVLRLIRLAPVREFKPRDAPGFWNADPVFLAIAR
jgi:hypothetical protein